MMMSWTRVGVLACFCLSTMARLVSLNWTISSSVFVARPLQAVKPGVARVVQRVHREDRVVATRACQVIKLLLAQHAMLFLVDKNRFFWQRFLNQYEKTSSLFSWCMEAQRVATQHKTLQNFLCIFVCNSTTQNETASQLMQLLFKLLSTHRPMREGKQSHRERGAVIEFKKRK